MCVCDTTFYLMLPFYLGLNVFAGKMFLLDSILFDEHSVLFPSSSSSLLLLLLSTWGFLSSDFFIFIIFFYSQKVPFRRL